MIRCFDILIGYNSALIRIRLHPDPDPVKIRIWPDPKSLDPVKIRIRPDPTVMDPVGSGSGRILKYGIRCFPTRKALLTSPTGTEIIFCHLQGWITKPEVEM